MDAALASALCDRLERLKHQNPIFSLSDHYLYPHKYLSTRRQITRPNITMDLPETPAPLPDRDIFAHIQQSVARIQKVVGANLMGGIRQGIDGVRITQHGIDAHIKTTLPEGLNGRATTNGRAIGRHELASYGIERCQPSGIALAEITEPLLRHDPNGTLVVVRHWWRSQVGHCWPPAGKAAKGWRSGDKRQLGRVTGWVVDMHEWR